MNRLIASRGVFRLLLAIPAGVMLWQFFFSLHNWGLLLDSSGEWAVRMLVLTLAVTPVRLLLKQMGFGPELALWLMKRRRDLGIAAFLYAALHLGTYVVRMSNLYVMLFDMQFVEYATGWIAFVALLALAVTSNDRAVHRLGTWWKPLQRLAYVSAIAAALHWFWIKLDHTGIYAHFVPLLVLEAYRLWYNFMRPAGAKH